MLNIKKRKGTIIFCLVAIIITLLLYQRDIGGRNINKLVFYGVVAAYALYANYRYLMMLTAFILPLTNGLPANYILPTLCVLILVKGWKYMKTPGIVWCSFFLISASEFLHLLFYSQSFDFIGYISYCCAIFLLLIIGGAEEKISDNSINALCFCLGSVIMFSIIMMNFNLMIGSNLLEEGVRIGNVSKYSGEETMTLQTNANNVALYSIAAISIGFTLWYFKKLPVWLLAAIAIPSFMAGVNSVSRTWFLSLGLLLFLYLIFRKAKSVTQMTVMLIAVFGIYLFFTQYSVGALDAYTERFSRMDLQTAGNRTLLFSEYNEWMFSHAWALIVGVGALTYKIPTQIGDSTHNALQQIVLAYGIPGLILFLSLFWKCIRRWYDSTDRMILLPLIIIAFFLMSLQFLVPYYCMYPFIASLFVLKMLHQNIKK